ncbi:Peptidyl-prolyl isomerase CWC27 [Golovinomyces cichoracearum]|uniref:peptidylprolyl isomerase n=1 Tax=Golovinomyces cichoracearum TaxID=62708 RepID=A0A420IUM6_9PEZI|nr:Peptidyl-prolyl isomerase CWC27 [Golovinomyces cichoracearum]
MSSLYNLEPQPTASCILHTTGGDISLVLWASQLPLTCRNFLQHCLDGYYDNTIFHRLIPNFVIQGGDPTGTGDGGESIYDGGAYSEPYEEGGIWPMEDRKGKNAGPQGVGFKDEFHSRIKFNRRGLLAMANDGPNSNGSQFFITLDNTPELQGKNTLFGRVEGDTIYNVARMGEAEIGEGDRPLYPVKIIGVEILVNYFKDMVKRERVAPVGIPVQIHQSLSRKKKKNTSRKLLSFVDEADDVTDIQPVVKKRKFDSRIVLDLENEPPKENSLKPVLSKITSPSSMLVPPILEPDSSVQAEVKQSASPDSAKKSEIKQSVKQDSAINSKAKDSASPEPASKLTSQVERANAQIAELKASMKRKIEIPKAPEKKQSFFQTLIPSTSVRGRKRHPGEIGPPDEKTLQILKAFQSKLELTAPLSPGPKSKFKKSESPNPSERVEVKEGINDEEVTLCDLHFIAYCQSCSKWDSNTSTNVSKDDLDTDLNGTSWMSHSLNFKEDKLGKDLSYRKKAEEELVVIDPREKARTLKEEVKARRDAKTDGTGREWDKFRVEKSGKTNVLAGKFTK